MPIPKRLSSWHAIEKKRIRYTTLHSIFIFSRYVREGSAQVINLRVEMYILSICFQRRL